MLHASKVPWTGCTASRLRLINNILPGVIFWLCYKINFPSNHQAPTTESNRTQARSLHTALNICLFPPLFFFSGLYYTDVISTASVLASFWLRSHPDLATRSLLRPSLLVLSGAVALAIRQTNIFWVAVFPAMLDLVECVEKGARVTYKKHRDLDGHPWRSLACHPTMIETCAGSWKRALAFDLPVADAFVHGW